MVRIVEIEDNFKAMILSTLDKYFAWRGQATFDDEGKVSHDGDMAFKKSPPRGILPVKFGTIGGNFECGGTGLVSLEGAPRIIQGSAGFGNNKLKSLKGGPETVGGRLYIENNPLTSLEYLSTNITKILITWNPNLPLLRLVGKTVIILDNVKVEHILQDYEGKSSRTDILNCQKALIDAGFVGNAAW